MAVTTRPDQSASTTRLVHIPPQLLPTRLPALAILVAGVAVAFLVGRDGSSIWQAGRVVATAVIAAAALHGVGWQPRWVRGLVAFSVGVVATAMGVGIGLPHLTKTGWSPVALAGLASLTAGVVLLAAGGACIVRVANRWWRLPVAVAALTVAVVALWAGGQAVAATNVPRTQIRSATPADRGYAYQDVAFETADGVRLSGWYLPSANRAAVVLLHGAGSTRSDVLGHAVVLARHGFGVLLFDARGHGRSGGRAMDFGWYGDQDIAGAVSYLQDRPEVDGNRIAAVGMSMGGEEVIGAAASDARIRAVVAEGATNRVAADKEFLSEVYGFRGRVQQRLEWLTYNTTDLLTDAHQPIALRDAARTAAPRPILLIAAGNMPDEANAGRYIRQAAPGSVQLWQVPNTGHTQALATHPAEWEQHVGAFLAAALSQR